MLHTGMHMCVLCVSGQGVLLSYAKVAPLDIFWVVCDIPPIGEMTCMLGLASLSKLIYHSYTNTLTFLSGLSVLLLL